MSFVSSDNGNNVTLAHISGAGLDWIDSLSSTKEFELLRLCCKQLVAKQSL